MRLDTLKIRNFKSFKDEITLGPLLDFMCIVGPNGCGKSNLMDAVCFVFGESVKNLRVNDIRQLVNKNAEVGDVGEVCAEFSSDILLVGFRRNTNDEYFVDDEMVTKQVYIKRLEEVGIVLGARNFMIPQGTINQLVSNELSANKRMEIFERISGSYKYRKLYEQLQGELTAANSEFQFLLKHKKSLMKEKRIFSAEKEYAVMYGNNLSKLEENKNTLFYKFYYAPVTEELQFLVEKISSIVESQEFLRSFEKSADSVDGNFEKLREDYVERTKNIHALNKKIRELNDDVAAKKSLVSEMNSQQSVHRLKLQSSEVDYQKCLQKKNELNDKLEFVQVQIDNLKNKRQNDVMNKENMNINDGSIQEFYKLKELFCRKEANKNMILAKSELESKCNAIGCSLNSENEQLSANTRSIEQLKSSINHDELANNLAIVQEKIDKLNTALNEKNTLLNHNTEKIKFLNKQIDVINNELSQLKIDLCSERYLTAKNEQCQFLKAHFSNNELFIGRLQEMIVVNSDVSMLAVTKALMPFLDSFVVANSSVAHECIKMLRQRHENATFIAFDMIQDSASDLNSERIFEGGLYKNTHYTDNSGKKVNYQVSLFSQHLDINSSFITDISKKRTLLNFVLKKIAHVNVDSFNVYVKQDIFKNVNFNMFNKVVFNDGTMVNRNGIVSSGRFDLTKKLENWDQSVLFKKKQQLKEQRKKILQKLPEENEFVLKNLISKMEVELDQLKASEALIKENMCNSERNLNEVDRLNKQNETIKQTIKKLISEQNELNEKLHLTSKNYKNLEKQHFRDFFKKLSVDMSMKDFEENCVKKSQQLEKIFNESLKKFESDKNSIKHSINTLCNDKILESKQTLVRKEKEFIENENAKLNKLNMQINEFLSELSEFELQKVHAEKELAAVEQKMSSNSKLLFFRNDEKTRFLYELNSYSEKITAITTLLDKCANEYKVNTNNYETRRINLSQFSSNLADVTFYKIKNDPNFSSPSDKTEEQLKKEIEKIQKELNKMQVDSNTAEKLDYYNTKTDKTNSEISTIKNKISKIEKSFDRVKNERLALFKKCFDSVSEHIQNVYSSLTKNANSKAFITVDNLDDDPFELVNNRYVSSVRLNFVVGDKNFYTLDSLSGGEKVLAACSFLFAVLKYKPCPVLIMDEIDAALDYDNLIKLSDFIHNMPEFFNTQILMISLKNDLFCRSQGLIGVTKSNNFQNSQKSKERNSCVFSLDLRPYDTQT